MSDSLTRGVKASLKMQYYVMNDSWLNECIEYYVSEHNNPSQSEVLAFVISQWQLSDLREISCENGCLPRNLARERCIEMSGRYILQMDKMYDVATSKYSQLERIRNISNGNVKATEINEGRTWEPRQRRTMQFHLTDGVQDVVAIEREPMRFLKDILPGYKLTIVGPVVCRRGVLMLKENNVLGIGGEVEGLLIRNAMENVLARALHLEENPDPYNDNEEENNDDKNGFFEDEFEINIEELTQIERSSQGDDDGIPVRGQSANDRSDSVAGTMGSGDDSMVLTDDDPACNRQPYPGTSRSDANCFGSSDDARSIPLRVLPKERGKASGRSDDSIVVAEQRITPSDKLKVLRHKENTTSIDTKERPPSAVGVELSVSSEDDLKFGNIEVTAKQGGRRIDDGWVKEQQQDEEVPKGDLASSVSSDRETRYHRVSCNSMPTTIDSGSREVVRRNVVDVSKSKASSVDRVARSAELTTSDDSGGKETATLTLTLSGKRPAGTVSPPVASPPKVRCVERVPSKICDLICDVIKEATADTVAYRTIRGRVTILNKLSKRDSSWHLAATITDDSAHIDVIFSSEVLERLLGFGVEEFSRKKKMLKRNPQVEDELRKGFRTAENALKRMDALMRVKLSPGNSVTVVGITELTNEQKVMIEKRAKLFKL